MEVWQVGDRTLLVDLFRIVSERSDAKFKFLSLSPNVFLSATEATAAAMATDGQAEAESTSQVNAHVRESSLGLGKSKGTQFISGKVK